MTTPDDGVYLDIPFKDYAGWNAINASAIKAGRRSSLHMQAYLDGATGKQTSAMSLGTLIHTAVLERDKLADVPVFDGDKRKKEWKEFKAAWGEDVASSKDMDVAQDVARSVMENPESRLIISTSKHEVCLVWSDRVYGKAKARIDILGDTFFADLKSTGQVDVRTFMKQYWGALGYWLQMGWITEGIGKLEQAKTGLRGYVISAETDTPFDVCVYECDNDCLEVGRIKAVEIATNYRTCEAIGAWPGVAKDVIVGMTVPEWMKEDWEVKR